MHVHTVPVTNHSEQKAIIITTTNRPCEVYRLVFENDKLIIGSGEYAIVEPNSRINVETGSHFFYATVYIEFCGIWYNMFRNNKCSVSRKIEILPKLFNKIVV